MRGRKEGVEGNKDLIRHNNPCSNFCLVLPTTRRGLCSNSGSSRSTPLHRVQWGLKFQNFNRADPEISCHMCYPCQSGSCISFILDRYIYIYTHTHTHTQSICVYIYTHTHTYTHSICVCVYIYIYIYTHTHTYTVYAYKNVHKELRCSYTRHEGVDA